MNKEKVKGNKMSFFKDLKQAFVLLRRNWQALALFELIYKFVISVVGISLIRGGIQLLLSVTGLTVITQENITLWLKNPLALLAIVLFALLAAFLSLLDSMAVVHCMNASYYDETVTAQDLFASALRDATRALLPKNWMLVVYILLIAPLAGAFTASGLVTQLKVPGFIEDYLAASPWMDVAYRGGLLLLAFLAYRWVFSIHAFCLGPKSYGKAAKESGKLLRLHPIKSGVSCFLWIVLMMLCFGLVAAAGPSVVACVVIKKLVDVQNQLYMGTIAISTIMDVCSYIWKIIAVPLVFAFVSALYYDLCTEAGEEPPKKPLHTPQPKLIHWAWRGVAAVMVMVLTIGVVVEGVSSNIRYDKDGELVVQPAIAAHRGSSVEKPENTMPAYEQAIEEGADWIEMDVHQTKDGVVVVAHDATLRRIAGVNKNIYDLTYDELKTYDVGSWFSPEYSDLRILTLDELIKAVKGRIPLNIELKPTGHEPNFEENVIQIVKDNDFGDQCVLASLNQNTVRRIEELAPEMDTLYLMAAEQGDLWKLDFADGFSIEESFVTANLVSAMHSHGKTVWAWTLNTEESVSKMQAAGVDYLLTDMPVMARSVITKNRMSNLTAQVLTYVFPTPIEPEDTPDTAESA